MRSELENAHDLNKGMVLSALSIREINIADAEAAAQLSGELGYPVSAGIMRERRPFPKDSGSGAREMASD
jgi:hypothetical protein